MRTATTWRMNLDKWREKVMVELFGGLTEGMSFFSAIRYILSSSSYVLSSSSYMLNSSSDVMDSSSYVLSSSSYVLNSSSYVMDSSSYVLSSSSYVLNFLFVWSLYYWYLCFTVCILCMFQYVLAPGWWNIRHPHYAYTRRLQSSVCTTRHRSTGTVHIQNQTLIQVSLIRSLWVFRSV